MERRPLPGERFEVEDDFFEGAPRPLRDLSDELFFEELLFDELPRDEEAFAVAILRLCVLPALDDSLSEPVRPFSLDEPESPFSEMAL